ncbi:MAG: hypothetical protein OEY84_00400 [Rhodospirillaceae bacterium]|nr:hypothetical protein [Rhodospirillaceae bacterium]
MSSKKRKTKKKNGFASRAVSRFRLLPVVIFFSVLMLTARVSDIWKGVEGLSESEVGVGEAQAQAPAPDQPQMPAAQEDPATPNAGQDAGTPMGDDPLMAAEPLTMPNEDPSAIAARMLSDDPTLLTQTEIDLLQKLAERRQEIELRAREIETREAMLQAAEARIDKKIDDFKVLKATLDDLIKQYDGQQDSQLASLVKIYENMKPKDAARIFEEMEMATLLMVAERMKERSLAPVMAKMDPIKAKEMTVELAKMRKLPRPGDSAG